MRQRAEEAEGWPEVPYEEWKETLATLHMWLQIVGKVRVAYVPWVNHQWHVTLHVTSRGLTSRPVPWDGGTFQMDFDFIDHMLHIWRSDGQRGRLELRPRSVADFYHKLLEELRGMGIVVEIHGMPNEVSEPIPFEENERDGEYQSKYANRFFRVLSSSTRVMEEFRGGFLGKCSPVHLFWGAMDLAVTRFSGGTAPKHPGGIPHLPDWITREAYSHELSSAGFWPGGEAYPYPIFYSYAYPDPPGFSEAQVSPRSARWDEGLSEFILPYERVRAAASPEKDLMGFLESTYAAAADLGGWNRTQLEWGPGQRPPVGGRGRER